MYIIPIIMSGGSKSGSKKTGVRSFFLITSNSEVWAKPVIFYLATPVVESLGNV